MRSTRARIRILEAFCWVAILLVATFAGCSAASPGGPSSSPSPASIEYIENEGYKKMFSAKSEFPDLKCTSQTSPFNPDLPRMAVIPQEEHPIRFQFQVDGLKDDEEVLRQLLKDVQETAKQGQPVLLGKSAWYSSGDTLNWPYRNQKGENCYILNITEKAGSSPEMPPPAGLSRQSSSNLSPTDLAFFNKLREKLKAVRHMAKEKEFKDKLVIVDDLRETLKSRYSMRRVQQIKDMKKGELEALVEPSRGSRNLTPTGVESSKISVFMEWSGSRDGSPLDQKSSQSRESSVEELQLLSRSFLGNAECKAEYRESSMDGRYLRRSEFSPIQAIEGLKSMIAIEGDQSHLKTSSLPGQISSSSNPPQFSSTHRKSTSVDLGNDLPSETISSDVQQLFLKLKNRSGSSAPPSAPSNSEIADSKSPMPLQASGSPFSKADFLDRLSIQAIDNFLQSKGSFEKCFNYTIKHQHENPHIVIEMATIGLNPIRKATISLDHRLDTDILKWVVDCFYHRYIDDSTLSDYEVTKVFLGDSKYTLKKGDKFLADIEFQMQDIVTKSLPQEVNCYDCEQARLKHVAHSTGLSISNVRKIDKCSSIEFSNGVKAGRLVYNSLYWSPSMEMVIFQSIQQILAGNHRDFMLISSNDSAIGSFVAIQDEVFEIRDLLNNVHGEVTLWDADQSAPSDDFHPRHFNWSGMIQSDLLQPHYRYFPGYSITVRRVKNVDGLVLTSTADPSVRFEIRVKHKLLASEFLQMLAHFLFSSVDFSSFTAHNFLQYGCTAAVLKSELQTKEYLIHGESLLPEKRFLRAWVRISLTKNEFQFEESAILALQKLVSDNASPIRASIADPIDDLLGNELGKSYDSVLFSNQRIVDVPDSKEIQSGDGVSNSEDTGKDSNEMNNNFICFDSYNDDTTIGWSAYVSKASDFDENDLADARPDDNNAIKKIGSWEDADEGTGINKAIPGGFGNKNNLVEEHQKETKEIENISRESTESREKDDVGAYPNVNTKTKEIEDAESEIQAIEGSTNDAEQPQEDTIPEGEVREAFMAAESNESEVEVQEEQAPIDVAIPQDEAHEAFIAAESRESEELEIQKELAPTFALSKELSSAINPDVESHGDVLDSLQEQRLEINPDDDESVDVFPVILARNPVMPQTRRLNPVEHAVTMIEASASKIPATILDSLTGGANVAEPETVVAIFQGNTGRSLENEARFDTLDKFSLENESIFGTVDDFAEVGNVESQEIIVQVMIPKYSNYLQFSISKVSQQRQPLRPAKHKISWKSLAHPMNSAYSMLKRGKLYTFKMTKAQFVKLFLALKNYLSRMKKPEIPEIYPLESEQHHDLPPSNQHQYWTGLMQALRNAFSRAKSVNFSAFNRSLSKFKKPQFPKVVPMLKTRSSKMKKPESRSLTSRVMSSLPSLPKWLTYKDAPKEPAPLTKGTKPPMLALTYCGENEEEIEICSSKRKLTNSPVKKERSLVLSSRPSIILPSGKATRTSSTRNSLSTSSPSSRVSSSPAAISPPSSSKIYPHQSIRQQFSKEVDDRILSHNNESQSVVSYGDEEVEVLEKTNSSPLARHDPVAHPFNPNQSGTSSSKTLQDIIRNLIIEDDGFIGPDDEPEEVASSDDEELDEPQIDLYWLNRPKNSTSSNSGPATPLNGNSKSVQASNNTSSSPKTKELSNDDDDDALSEEANDNRSAVQKWLFPKPTPLKRPDGLVPTHPSESESDWTDSEDDGLTWIERQQKEEREVEEIFHVGHLFMGGAVINFSLISLLLLL